MNSKLFTWLGAIIVFSNLTQANQYDHPRLFFSKADEVTLKARIATDPIAKKIYKELIRRTDSLLSRPTSEHRIKDGRRLLAESRYALQNILHTAMVWRLTRERKYFNRAVLELDASCSFKDWNPSHFLDTTEMSTAVAIGYDWLYNDLTEEQRERYSAALTKLGLSPARAGYTEPNRSWWSYRRSNWTQVCAAGLIIAERVLEKKGDSIHPSRQAARAVLGACRDFYAPNGGYPEGPLYWHYGSIYHVLALATVRNDRQEMAMPTPTEFKRTALFPMHLTGATDYVFNFSDSGSQARKSKVSAAQSWIIREFNDPSSIHYIRQKIATDILVSQKNETFNRDRFFPLHLLWLPKKNDKKAPSFPLDSHWLGIQPIATFRSSWTDANAIYFAIKGGLAKASHGHMDIGSFILESDGVRWAEDLGSDNYNLPGYFRVDEKRWKYFRSNNLSHNTLVIGNKLQFKNAKSSPVIDFKSGSKISQATIDMTPAYEGQAEKIIRKAVLNKSSKQVTITDTITSAKGAVRWAMLTRAKIVIEGKVAVLKSNDKSLKVIRNDNHGGEWKILDAKPPTAVENQNEEYQILTFTASAQDNLKLSVILASS